MDLQPSPATRRPQPQDPDRPPDRAEQRGWVLQLALHPHVGVLARAVEAPAAPGRLGVAGRYVVPAAGAADRPAPLRDPQRLAEAPRAPLPATDLPPQRAAIHAAVPSGVQRADDRVATSSRLRAPPRCPAT